MRLRPKRWLGFAISGIAAAVFAAPFTAAFVGLFAAGPFGFPLGFVLGIGAVPEAVKIAALPAALLGAGLWTAGERRHWLRRKSVWAAVGSAAGFATWSLAAVFPLGSISILGSAPGTPAWPFALGFAAGGAAAALSFLGLIRILHSVAWDDDEEAGRET